MSTKLSSRISNEAFSELSVLAADRNSNKTHTVEACVHTFKYLKDREKAGGTILIQNKDGSFEKVILP